jgi:hypothetical protein
MAGALVGALGQQSRQINRVLTHQLEVLEHLECGIENTTGRVIKTTDRVAKLDS